ncbi:MAG: DUF6242 domain-containing protein [Prevotella sp.]
MKRFTLRLCALIAGAAALSSCLNDSHDEGSSYSDMAITQFTLGTLNRYIHTTSSKTGNDTVTKSTLSGSVYKMSIDQLNCRIHNTAELPVGTDIEHVVCTVTTKNGGVVAIQSMTSDSLKWYSSSDSISFASPRIFRVYAADGSGYRNYTVELNVSSTTGITFGWQLEKTDDTLSGWTDKKLVAVGDTVQLVDVDSIVGASTNECYMIDRDGLLKCSRDGGISWQEEMLDEADSLLPARGTAALVSWPYAPADNTDYVLMVGKSRQDDDPSMRVWRKICPHEGGGRWVYMPAGDLNHYPLPLQDSLSMACYNGTVLAIGSSMVIYQSRDQGITWRTNDTYALPSNLTGTSVVMTADVKGQLWLLTNTGQLWRGYDLN